MIKVLQLSNYYYPNIGGIEQVARDISRSLSGNEIEQKIICFNTDAADDNYKCNHKETVHDYVDGVEVIRCGSLFKVSSQCISTSYGRELKNAFDEFAPDIVIMHCPNPFAVHYLLKYTKRDFKLVVYWHSDIVKQKFLSKFFVGQTKRLLMRADKIVATSPDYIDGSSFLTEYRRKCIVIPNCIDKDRLMVTDYVNEKTLKIREQFSGKIICFTIGRHVEYKGIRYLIEAASKLNDNIKIIIGGEGPLTSSLKSSVRNENIEFVGRLSNEDLAAYFNSCDIFCLPSIARNEAFGLVLAEAMSFGKPCVTFRIPGSGVNYVNQNGITGISCELYDTDEFARAINSLAENESIRILYGNNAQNRVVNVFGFGSFKQSINSLLGDINV